MVSARLLALFVVAGCRASSALEVADGSVGDADLPDLVIPDAAHAVLDQDSVTDEDLEKRELQLLVRTREGGVVNERTADNVATVVREQCVARIIAADSPLAVECQGLTSAPVSEPGGACPVQLCQAHLQLCTAHTLLELASTVAPVDVGTYRIVPQSTASNVALEERALVSARDVLRFAGAGLATLNISTGSSSPSSPSGGSTSTFAAVNTCNTTWASKMFGSGDALQTYAGSFASSYVEAYHLVWEIAERAARDNVAAADEAWSRYPSSRKAAYFAQVAPLLSRARAAQLLIGGPAEGGLKPFQTPEGLPAPISEIAAPSPAAASAVRLLRASGISPTRLATDDLTTLLTGGADPVRARLSEVLAIPAMAQDDVPTLMKRFGLTSTDFVEAQKYLVTQNKALARSESVTLPSSQVSAKTLSFSMFGSTVTEPSRANSLVYQEWVQRTAQPLDDRTGPSDAEPYVNPVASLYLARGAAQTVDYALSLAHYVASSANVNAQAANVLSPVLAQGIKQRPHRLQICMQRKTTSAVEYQVKVFANDIAQAQQIRLVRGRDGVECATEGKVDGGSCDLQKLIESPPSVIAVPPTAVANGFAQVARFTLSEAPQTLFAVKLKPGMSQFTAGSFETVAAFKAPPEPSPTTLGMKYCTMIPVVPELGNRAATTISPSPRDMAKPEQTCAGLPLNQRIPLEDELTDDGDAYESSWKHYLTLARQAASEADALGEELIGRGLEMDQRSEGALEELEQLCGAAINVDDLFRPDLTDATSNACTQQNQCVAGFVCSAGKCRKDGYETALAGAAGDAAKSRLARCLGPTSTVPFVALGSGPVCIWHKTGDTNTLCQNASKAQPCPYDPEIAPNGQASCKPPTGVGDVATVLVSDKLNLFVANAQTQGGGAAPCDDLRKVRDSANVNDAATRAAFNRLVASNFFDPPHVRALAANLSWEPRIGMFGAVLSNGLELINMGDLRKPEPLYWPCTSTHAPGEPTYTCANNAKSLFCAAPISCSATGDQKARLTLHQRLARAVFAARISAGVRFDDLKYASTVSGGQEAKNATDYTLRNGAALRTGTVRESGSTYELPGSCRTDADDPGGVPAPAAAGYLHFGGGQSYWRDMNWFRTSTKCRKQKADAFFVAATWRGPGHDVITPRASQISGVIWSGLGARAPSHTGAVRPFVRESLLGVGDPRELVLPCLAPDTADLTWYYHKDNNGIRGYFNHDGLRREDLLDAAELMCEMERPHAGSCDLTQVPTVTTVDDLSNLRQYLACASSTIERSARLAVFANMPQHVVQSLQASSPNGAYPLLGGKFAEQVIAIREGLLDIATLPADIARQLRMFNNDLQILQLGLKKLANRRRMADVQYIAQAASQMSGVMGSLTTDPFQFGLALTSALSQLASAAQVRDLTKEDASFDEDQDLLEFQNRFESYASTFADYGSRLRTGMEKIDGGLATLESLQREGQTALAKAAFADSDAAGRHFHVNTVMRRRMNTLAARYEDARLHAVRMAFLAKRAIEMRIGMALQEMDEPLTLVAAPRTWQASLCTMSGIDYNRIRDASDLPADNYADGYIGDYVDKLERVVESYQLDFPSHAAADTSVLSLRDELQSVRDNCLVDVDNLLYHASQLDQPADDSGREGWDATGCVEITATDDSRACTNDGPCAPLHCSGGFCEIDEDGNGIADPVIRNCVNATPSAQLVVASREPSFGTPRIYDVRFGAVNGSMPKSFVSNQSKLAQVLDLPAGRYRFSYYVDTSTSAWVIPVVSSLSAPGTNLLQTVANDGVSGMQRQWAFFQLIEPTIVSVGFTFNNANGGLARLAAPQVEDVANDVPGAAPDPSSYPPRDFADTFDERARTLPMCEDTSGEVFRAQNWTRDCVHLCADGYQQSCPDGSGDLACYWETQFAISQSDIEHGRLIKSGGFARGNYDYRIESIGLNFVGTATRDCEDSNLPSTCYSAAYVPYSIEHRGPYELRNYLGEDFEAPLYTGRIEHARGLAAERYLSNPLSSADATLMQSYVRRELRGRPLHGTFVIRVWDEEGVSFEGIRDVQILLDYRYRTRFE